MFYFGEGAYCNEKIVHVKERPLPGNIDCFQIYYGVFIMLGCESNIDEISENSGKKFIYTFQMYIHHENIFRIDTD